MTRREIFRGLAAIAGLRRAGGSTPAETMLVVVRLARGHSDLLMVSRGVEVLRVRIPVIDPAVMNDVELAGFIRLGLKGTGGRDMPLFLADGVDMTGFTRIA